VRAAVVALYARAADAVELGEPGRRLRNRVRGKHSSPHGVTSTAVAVFLIAATSSRSDVFARVRRQLAEARLRTR
jgi:hypothetical protein